MMDNSFGLAPQQQTPQAAPQPPSQDEIMGGHKAIDATMNGLIGLVSRPTGELTKKNVFDSVSEMIANGAFPSPEAKQTLIGGLAKLPDDEPGIRKALGEYLLHTATFQNHYHNAFGPPPEPEAQQLQARA